MQQDWLKQQQDWREYREVLKQQQEWRERGQKKTDESQFPHQTPLSRLSTRGSSYDSGQPILKINQRGIFSQYIARSEAGKKSNQT